MNNEKGDVIYEKLRKAGEEFWPNLKEADERKRHYEAMKDQFKTIEERLATEFKPEPPEEGQEPEPLSEEKQQEKATLEQEKADLELKIMEAEAEKNTQKKPITKVKKHDRLSIILFGPEKSGK